MATCQACGIKPTARGSVSTEATTSDGSIFASVVAIPNLAKMCITPDHIKQASLNLGHMYIHDTYVVLPFGVCTCCTAFSVGLIKVTHVWPFDFPKLPFIT